MQYNVYALHARIQRAMLMLIESMFRNVQHLHHARDTGTL